MYRNRKIYILLKHLPEAAGAWAAYWVFRLLPFKMALNFGGWLGRLGAKLSLSKRARQNIQACFPHLSSDQVDGLVVEMWDNFGRVAAEYTHAHDFWDGKKLKNIEVVGSEHLKQLRDDGKGGVIFTAHIGNWQMITLVAKSLGLELTQMYRTANNPMVDAMMIKAQKDAVEGIITKKKGGPKALLSLLRQGGHAFMLVDQKMGEGLSVPFLGRNAMTATGIARLYLNNHYPLLPARCERVTPFTFRVTFYPPISFTPTGDAEKDTYDLLCSTNALIGKWIEERPGQWLWIHRRWT